MFIISNSTVIRTSIARDEMDFLPEQMMDRTTNIGYHIIEPIMVQYYLIELYDSLDSS